MKAIHNNKLYDTDKAEIILSYRRKVRVGNGYWFPFLLLSFCCFAQKHDIDLYRTPKNAYFEHDKHTNKIEPITQSDAMDIVLWLDIDVYLQHFNDQVDEA